MALGKYQTVVIRMLRMVRIEPEKSAEHRAVINSVAESEEVGWPDPASVVHAKI